MMSSLQPNDQSGDIDESEIAQLGIGRKFQNQPFLRSKVSLTIFTWLSRGTEESGPLCL